MGIKKPEKAESPWRKKKTVIIAVIVLVIILGILIIETYTSPFTTPSLGRTEIKPITTEQDLSQAQNDVSNELANLSSDLQGIRDALG